MERNSEDYMVKDEALEIPVDGEEMVAASYVAQFASNYTMQTLFGMDIMGGDEDGLESLEGQDYFQMTEEEIEEEYQEYLKKMADIEGSKKNPPSLTKFSNLPYDILLHIMADLPWKTKMALYNTSNMTRSVVLDPLVWREIDCQKVACSKENVKSLEQVLELILPQGIGSHLKSLHLGLFHLYLKENILVDLMAYAPNLEKICVPAAIKVTKEEVEAIYNNCKNLTILELPDCRILNDELISNFQRLTKIDISAIQVITIISKSKQQISNIIVWIY